MSLRSYLFLLGITSAFAATCPAVIDDFAKPNANLLGNYVSDDGSMKSIQWNAKTLIVSPKSSGSYFYETGFCGKRNQDAIAQTWTGIQLKVKSSKANGDFLVNLQTGIGAGCNAKIQNNYLRVSTILGAKLAAAQATTITIPLERFGKTANLNNILAVSFEDFQAVDAIFTFSLMTFTCGGYVQNAFSRLIFSAKPPPPNPGNQCTQLLIDDFTKLNANQNAIGGSMGSDQTTNKFALSNGQLLLNPKAGSYFYEAGFCEAKKSDLIANRWAGIQFMLTLRDPKIKMFQINFQTGETPDCRSKTFDNYINIADLKIPFVANKPTLVQIPFWKFSWANYNSLRVITFEGFDPIGQDILIGPISFFCSDQFPAPKIPVVVPEPLGPAPGSVKCGTGLAKCPSSMPCCSVNGVCGVSTTSCAAGCQAAFGTCFTAGQETLYAPKSGRFQIIGSSRVPAMHMIVHPNGKVIFLDKVSDYTLERLPNGHPSYSAEFDPKTGKAELLAYSSNSFCSAGGFLADGTLANFGGDETPGDARMEDGKTGVRLLKRPCTGPGCNWIESTNIRMAGKRWYPTTVNLEDGNLMIIGGIHVIDDLNREYYSTNTWELFPPGPGGPKESYLPFLRDAKPNHLYPHAVLLNSGRLFLLAGKKSIVFDYKANTTKPLPDLAGMFRNYPEAGASVILPLSSAQNYAVTVMVCGGSNKPDISAVTDKSCGLIRPEDPNPTWSFDPMPESRVMLEGINLPDGTILFINGAATGAQGFESAKDPIFHPLLYIPFAPAGKRWITLADSKVARLYHSTAQLLPDGTIIVAGSGPNTVNIGFLYGDANIPGLGFPTDFRVEIFTPPYLLTGLPRPVASNIPATIKHGQTFTMNAQWDKKGEATPKLALIHGGFATHSMHFSQRMIYLDFTINGNTLTVKAPPNGRVAPPGPYMLFVVSNGVPGVASWVTVTV